MVIFCVSKVLQDFPSLCSAVSPHLQHSRMKVDLTEAAAAGEDWRNTAMEHTYQRFIRLQWIHSFQWLLTVVSLESTDFFLFKNILSSLN